MVEGAAHGASDASGDAMTGYRENPRPEQQLQRRPAPDPAWPLRASLARRAWAWCTGRLRALENRQILRMPATRAYELAETSDRMWRRVARLRPNIYAEIEAEHAEDYRRRMDAWEREHFAERDGRRSPKPVPLPGPPKRISE
jgi:hypothetical protein